MSMTVFTPILYLDLFTLINYQECNLVHLIVAMVTKMANKIGLKQRTCHF